MGVSTVPPSGVIYIEDKMFYFCPINTPFDNEKLHYSLTVSMHCVAFAYKFSYIFIFNQAFNSSNDLDDGYWHDAFIRLC